MALLKTGAIGRPNGKFDNGVIAPWKGLTVLRGLPKKSSKPAKLSQLDQRARFKLVGGFISGLGEIIGIGYQNTAGNVTPYNIATRYHLENAITGVYPNYAIDFAAVRLSDGKRAIDLINDVVKTEAVNNRTTLTWAATESGRIGTLPTDTLAVVFYNATQDFFMTHPAAALRSALTAVVRIPVEEDGDVIHGWFIMISTDGMQVSRSKYLGIIAYS